jgi:hypothetical protein
MGIGIRHADHVAPSVRKKLTLTSPTSDRSVGIVRLRTQATELSVKPQITYDPNSVLATHVTLTSYITDPALYIYISMNILYAFLVSMSATCPAAESHPVLETSDGGTALVLRGTVRNCFCVERQVMVARLGCETQPTALGCPDKWQCLCC